MFVYPLNDPKQSPTLRNPSVGLRVGGHESLAPIILPLDPHEAALQLLNHLQQQPPGGGSRAEGLYLATIVT